MAVELVRVDNPFTGEIVLERELLARPGVDEVMKKAHAAQLEWRSVPLSERMRIAEVFCDRFIDKQDQYAQEISAQMGKPVSEARGEVATMVDRARQMIAIAEEGLAPIRLPAKDNFERWISREPVGVVVVLAAWNYPLLTAINATIAAVLAGDSVVLKHSARTPRCAEQIAETFEQAGVPTNTVQAAHMNHEIVAYMVTHPLTGYVSFTGSVPGGRAVYRTVAERRFIDVGLELGGKDPAYVTEDIDFDKTVPNVIEGALYNAGQSCCAVERIYVAKSIYDRFLEASVSASQSYRPGDPVQTSTTLGPMAQRNAPAYLAAQVSEAHRMGARVLCGGSAIQFEGQGRFFAPTIVADTDHKMAIAREESFGPVVAIMPVDNDDEAVERMNDSPYGLTASVWTRDVDRAKRILPRVDAGTVFLNRCDYLDPLLAWTGVKDTGKGASLSKLGFASVTRPKSYHLRLAL